MNRRTFIKSITGAAAAVAAGVFSGRKVKAEPTPTLTLLDTRPDNWITPEKLRSDHELDAMLYRGPPLVGCDDGTLRYAMPGEKPVASAVIARVIEARSA